MREVKTCDRCRHFKRRCDLVKPSCSRCAQAGVRCSFDVHQVAPLRETGTKKANASQASTDYLARATAIGSKSPQRLLATNGYAPFPIPPDAHLPVPAISSSISPVREPSAGVLNGLISPSVTSESPEPISAILSSGSDATFEFPSASSQTLSTSTHSQRVVRKRKRNCLSCQRCHRLKVKCDKGIPCSRCKSSNNGRDCHYSYVKQQSSDKHPSPINACDGHGRKAAPTTWKERFQDRGPSHWRDLMVKVRWMLPCSRKTSSNNYSRSRLWLEQTMFSSKRSWRPRDLTRALQNSFCPVTFPSVPQALQSIILWNR